MLTYLWSTKNCNRTWHGIHKYFVDNVSTNVAICTRYWSSDHSNPKYSHGWFLNSELFHLDNQLCSIVFKSDKLAETIINWNSALCSWNCFSRICTLWHKTLSAERHHFHLGKQVICIGDNRFAMFVLIANICHDLLF